MMDAASIRGKRFSVLGAARSGVAAAALLARHGARVFVSDRAAAEKLESARKELDSLGVGYEFGTNTDRVLEADIIVISPGVPSTIPTVKSALERNIPVISEVELGSWFCAGPIIGITGTNGKTTTTTLTGRLFEDAEMPTAVAGNIGTAFTQLADRVTKQTTVVLEVSSFQLDHAITFKPKVSVLLNITPDHLDRYEYSFAKYSASKTGIFLRQEEGDFLIYNADDAETVRQVNSLAPMGVHLLPFSLTHALDRGAWIRNGVIHAAVDGPPVDLLKPKDLGIPGIHNHYNAMAAALSALAMGVEAASIRKTLASFKGVEHRLEFVREVRGVRFVNDSKATNVDSVWYALQSYETPIILILGGRDKGNDYTRLFDLVDRNVRSIIAIGESAETVAAAFKGHKRVTIVASMQEAVDKGASLAMSGDVVLLSPACASFDWFDNYEHRGRVFKDLVQKLPG
jgi:UDP-N-acetylmuramoylalanine--D-glutamate ligase